MSELTEWNSFYVIVGSSAGALIGLQFVVMTLIAQRPVPRMAEAGAAFSTPSVVHFAVVLLLSAIMSAPWRTVGAVGVVWGLVGIGGIAYAIIVARRMRLQTAPPRRSASNGAWTWRNHERVRFAPGPTWRSAPFHHGLRKTAPIPDIGERRVHFLQFGQSVRAAVFTSVFHPRGMQESLNNHTTPFGSCACVMTSSQARSSA